MPFVIAFVVALVLVAIYARRHRGTRYCRWRRDATGDKGSLRHYRCAACGEEAFTASKVPPDTCKKNLSGGSL